MVTRNGTFIPKKSRQEMDALRAIARIAMAGREPFEGPVQLKVAAYMPIPPSWSRKKRAAALAGELHPVGPIDVTNIVKLIEDAIHAPRQQRAGRRALSALSPGVQASMQKVVIKDDKQIVRLTAWKIFSDNPRVVVEVSELQSPPTRDKTCAAAPNGVKVRKAADLTA